MYLRKEQRQATKTDKYFMSIISDLLQPLVISPITYLDQIYRVVKNQSILIEHILEYPRYFITKRSTPSASFFTKIAFSSKKTAELARTIIPDIYSGLNGVSDAILSSAEALSDDINDLDAMAETAQAKLIRKISATSIKSDNIKYESFTSNSTFTHFESTIVHTSAGVLCLAPSATKDVDITLNSITVNKDKGSLEKYTDISNNLNTYRFTDGYYFNRTFSSNPKFEISADKDIYSMRDGDLTTEYRVEWCSSIDNETLVFDFVISPTLPSKVDILNLVVSPCDVDSSLSSTINNVKLTNVSVSSSDRTVPIDVLTSFADNRITVGKSVYGSIENRPTIVAPYVYPSYAIPVFMNNVTSISVQLTCDIPQKIYYYEKDVYDQKGAISRTFNFLETLALNKYVPPTGRLDPLSLFTSAQMNDFAATVSKGYSTIDRKVETYRYSVGVRDIALTSTSYYREGSAVSVNMNDSDSDIYSVEIYVNENLFGGTTRYFVSTDKVSWIEVEPANRNASSLPTRVLFINDNPSEKDYVYPTSTSEVYVKAYLKGDTTFTPVIKSIIARVKHV